MWPQHSFVLGAWAKFKVVASEAFFSPLQPKSDFEPNQILWLKSHYGQNKFGAEVRFRVKTLFFKKPNKIRAGAQGPLVPCPATKTPLPQRLPDCFRPQTPSVLLSTPPLTRMPVSVAILISHAYCYRHIPSEFRLVPFKPLVKSVPRCTGSSLRARSCLLNGGAKYPSPWKPPDLMPPPPY